MPVLDQTYRRWEGRPTSYLARILVIPRYDALEILSRKAWTACYLVALLPPLLLLGYVYLAANSGVLASLMPGLKAVRIPLPGPVAWAYVTRLQLAFLLVFGLLVGPPLTTRDYANNALALYLSKAMRRWEYVAGRVAILVTLLSFASWVPLLVVWVIEASLAPKGWAGENAWLLGGVLASTIPWILVVVGLISAVAAHLHRSNLARAALLGLIFVTFPVGKMLHEQTGTAYSEVVSPLAMAMRVNQWAFERPEPAAASPPPDWRVTRSRQPIPVPVAFLVLGGWIGACVLVLGFRVRPVEVVK